MDGKEKQPLLPVPAPAPIHAAPPPKNPNSNEGLSAESIAAKLSTRARTKESKPSHERVSLEPSAEVVKAPGGPPALRSLVAIKSGDRSTHSFQIAMPQQPSRGHPPPPIPNEPPAVLPRLNKAREHSDTSDDEHPLPASTDKNLTDKEKIRGTPAEYLGQPGWSVLTWSNIQVTMQTPDKQEKQLLQSVSGYCTTHCLLAIMGSSGAGKTTLMNSLAMQKTNKLKVTGEVRVGGELMTEAKMREISAYVQQVDMFIGTLTVREQLELSAALRLPENMSKAERKARVDEVIKEMNLTSCEHTLIGIPNRTKGISIGEKKRLAFACEIMTDPKILFCDEPTSGLDSFMAEQVVRILHKMSRRGKIIISVIHQPSSQVFSLFDEVIFMAKGGRMALFSPVNRVPKFFRSFGCPELTIPASYNPPDFVLNTLSVSHDDPQQRKEDEKRVETVIAHYNATIGRANLEIHDEFVKAQASVESEKKDKRDRAGKASWLRQLSVIFKRSLITTVRDPLLLKVKTLQVVITALIIGVVNWQTEIRGNQVQNIEGMLYNCARDMNFLFIYPSVNVITSELPIIMREIKANIYDSGCYFVAKTTAELPQFFFLPLVYSIIMFFMTGMTTTFARVAVFCLVNVTLVACAVSVAYAGACAFGDEGIAITYMPMLVLPMLVFGGFYINYHNVPPYFQWVSNISWFRYGFEALQVNQWWDVDHIEGCTGVSNSTQTCIGEDGSDILKFRGLIEVDPTTHIATCLGALILLSFIFKAIGMAALSLRVRYSKS